MNKIFTILIVLFLFTFCSTKRVYRELQSVEDVQKINRDAKYLKAHLKDGKVYILYNWKFDSQKQEVQGYGKFLNINRELIESRTSRRQSKTRDSVSTPYFKIPLDQIAIFETNDTGNSLAPGLAIITGLSLALTIYCITNPKACWGSCPTFYASNGDQMILQAEGFSSSVAPILERKDLDMLYHTQNTGDELEIMVTNEALETHVIRKVDLIIVPKPKQGRVFASKSGNFYSSSQIHTPVSCIGPEGEFAEKVCYMDDKERYSLTDSLDLARKETLHITFDSIPNGKYGLVIGARQTLLTTFLFYQNLAYMGNSVGYWVAKLQNMEKEEVEKKYRLLHQLGGIEVSLKQKKWQKVGVFDETGPIATNVELIELPEVNDGHIHLQLKSTMGMWRINYLALVALDQKVEPIRVQPYKVFSNNQESPEAKDQLIDSTKTLIGFPGESYSLWYCLPEFDGLYEYFIESEGYYLEWIRKEWLKEVNPKMTLMMLRNPSRFLRKMAPLYKQIENEMDKNFWRSKYVTP